MFQRSLFKNLPKKPIFVSTRRSYQTRPLPISPIPPVPPSSSTFGEYAPWLFGSAVFMGSIYYALYGWSNNEAKHIVQEHKKPVVPEKLPESPSSVQQLQHKANSSSNPFVKYVLIGGGTASYHALNEIRANDPAANVLIISEELQMPYQRPPLSKELWDPSSDQVQLQFNDWTGKSSSVYYPGVDQIMTIGSSTELAQNSDLIDSKTFMLNASVDSIDASDNIIQLTNGEKVAYYKLLIATGSSPNKLPGGIINKLSKNTFMERVTTYRSLDDFRILSKALNGTPTTVLILGGGFLGSELAIATSKKPETKVIEVVPETGNLSLVLPEYLSKYTTDQMNLTKNVNVLPDVSVKALAEDSEMKVIKVELSDGKILDVDRVVVCCGASPNVSLAKKSGLEIDTKNGGIVVDSSLCTTVDDSIFAAGDVASFYDSALKQRRRVEHYDHACESGKIAGRNMSLVGKKPYTHQPHFWSNIGDIGFEAVGDLRGSEMETVSVWAKEGGKERTYKKGLLFYLDKEKKIKGVLLWNLYGKCDIARDVLKAGTGIEGIKDVVQKFDMFK